MAAIKKRGRAGLAGALVLSFIASFLLLAPVVYFPAASLSCAVFIFFYPSPTKRHLSAHEHSTKSQPPF